MVLGLRHVVYDRDRSTSGACSTSGDGGLGGYVFGSNKSQVIVSADHPGTCQVTLEFADGFSYSTTFTFATEQQSCGCGPYLAVTPGSVDVDNPKSTCILDAAPE
jgi:hypothetical protein